MYILKNEDILWKILGLLAIITIIASTYTKIALVLNFHKGGMSLGHSINIFIFHGLIIYLIVWIICVTSFFKWKPALLLNLITLYCCSKVLYRIICSKMIVTGPWVLSGDITMVSGILMSLCGLFLLILYLINFFKCKEGEEAVP